MPRGQGYMACVAIYRWTLFVSKYSSPIYSPLEEGEFCETDKMLVKKKHGNEMKTDTKKDAFSFAKWSIRNLKYNIHHQALTFERIVVKVLI